MSVAKSLMRGSFLRVSHTMLSMVVSFIMMPIFIGELGDQWYGVWTIVSGFIGVYFIFDLGVTSAVSRYISKYVGLNKPNDINTIINTALVIFIGIGLIVALLTITLSFFSANFATTPKEVEIYRILILITGISVALEFPFNAFAGIPEGNSRYDLLTYIRITTLALGAVANYYLVTNGYGVVAIAVVGFLSARASNLGYFFLARYLFPEMKLSRKFVRKEHFFDLFHFSKWSFAVEMAGNLPYRLNTLVIGYFLSAAWVTHYVIGQRLVEYTSKFLFQATNMMTPIFTQYHAKGDYENLREKFLFVIRLNAFLGMLAIGGLVTFADIFIQRWIGDDYPESYTIVLVRIFGVIGLFIFSSVNNVLYAVNKHHLIAKITVFDGVLTLVGAVVLVQTSLGIVGVAIAATVPALIGRALILPILTARLIDLSVWRLFRSVLPMIFLGGGLISVEYYVISELNLEANYADIVIYAALFSAFYCLFMVFAGLRKHEREVLFRALPFVPWKEKKI